MNYIKLGERIRTARKAAGYTQDQVSTILNVSRSTVVSMERGQVEVKDNQLKLLASAFNMPLDDLTKGCKDGNLMRAPGLAIEMEPDRHYAHLTDDERDLVNAVRHADWMDAIEMIAEMRRQRAEIE